MNDHNFQNWTIFCDADILVINKPAGILSIPDGYHPEYPHLRSILEPDFGRLYIVHRLDKDTSGVMVLARTPDAHRALNLQFDERSTHKEYQALIFGSPPWDTLEVNFPLTINGDRSHRTRVLPNKGKPASTGFYVNTRWQQAALVGATPHTGYTHQIRAHLGSIGYPILFDTLYTPPDLRNHAEDFYRLMDFSPDVFRPMLHAGQISFKHPVSGIEVEFSCPLPGDILRVINSLNKNRSSD
jgi:tRNA pseudouridine32 synthase / 23S rRNA pseudouridine746 synthase